MSPRSLSLGPFLLALGLTVAAAREPLAPLVEHVLAHQDGRAAWSIDFAALQGERRDLPIGVFDSGIGGLTVLEAILGLDAHHNADLKPGADGVPDFAGERFIYFGDQANMPYGNYPAQDREIFLRELILKDAVFLLGTRWRQARSAPPQFTKPPVKAIVIACNTATAYGLEDIRSALTKWKLDVPVIGVIEAGARAVAESLGDDGKAHGVAVMATVGTCASGAYPRAINRAMGQRGKPAPAIVQQGSVGLAGAIEGNPAFIFHGSTAERPLPYQGPAGDSKAAPLEPALASAYGFVRQGLLEQGELNSVPNYARYDVATLIENHRRNPAAPIDTVVLGCTHFPLAQRELAEAFTAVRNYEDASGRRPYAKVVAEEIRFIDPAEASARELFRELARRRLRSSSHTGKTPPAAQFYLSVPNPASPGIQLAPDGSLEPGYKSGRELGRMEIEDTVAVPLVPERLPSASAQLVKSLPAVWSQMQKAAPQGP